MNKEKFAHVRPQQFPGREMQFEFLNHTHHPWTIISHSRTFSQEFIGLHGQCVVPFN